MHFLFNKFFKLTLHIHLEHQAHITAYCPKYDQQIRNGLYSLEFDVMTTELSDCVIDT